MPLSRESVKFEKCLARTLKSVKQEVAIGRAALAYLTKDTIDLTMLNDDSSDDDASSPVRRKAPPPAAAARKGTSQASVLAAYMPSVAARSAVGNARIHYLVRNIILSVILIRSSFAPLVSLRCVALDTVVCSEKSS